MRRLATLGLALALVATPASASPSFDVVVTPAIYRIGVGETVQMYAYPPECYRDRKAPAPIGGSLSWKVEPESRAKISPTGALTALEPGIVSVTADPGATPAALGVGTPGKRW